MSPSAAAHIVFGIFVLLPLCLVAQPAAPLNPTQVPPWWSFNTTDNRACNSTDHYEDMLCPANVVQEITMRKYYDFQRCSPNNYDLACEAGFFSPDSTNTNRTFNNIFYPVLRCCPGHYCPGGAVCMIPCSVGGYCPEVTTRNSTFCDPYNTVAKPYLGCGGAETDFPCPARYYCPDTQTMISCPEDYYCPAGTKYVMQKLNTIILSDISLADLCGVRYLQSVLRCQGHQS